jgi:hypothetical protein
MTTFEDRVRERAYYIYENTGREDVEANWLEAERLELEAERLEDLDVMRVVNRAIRSEKSRSLSTPEMTETPETSDSSEDDMPELDESPELLRQRQRDIVPDTTFGSRLFGFGGV